MGRPASPSHDDNVAAGRSRLGGQGGAGTGDPRADRFIQLFLDNRPRIYGLIVSLVPNLADADDLLQDVLALMWDKFDRFEPGTDFAAWGLRFAHFTVLKYYEKKRGGRRVTFSSDLLALLGEEVAAASSQRNARMEALQRCLARLPEKVRRLIELRYEPGASVQSVADRVGQSVHAVYKALNRAHEALLQCVRRSLSAEERS